jgi:multiple sugar transport system permease protein
MTKAPPNQPRVTVTPRAPISSAQVLLWLGLGIGGLAIAIPFLYMIFTSFKTPDEAYAQPPTFLPSAWRLENFAKLFELVPFVQMFWNSLWTSAVIATANIVVGAPAAYAFARLRFAGKDVMFQSHVLTMVVPWQITLIPTFLLVRWFGWIDSYTALIVPSIANAYSMFMLYQFFKSLPRSLEESVLMDGGSWGTALRYVALPTSAGAIMATWLLSFLGNWQSFVWPSIVLNSQDKMVLPVGLLALQNHFAINEPVLMAGATLSVVPTIIAYLFTQRYLTDAALQSGLKG